MFTLIEKKIIALVQGDVPVVKRPYLSLAKKLRISEKFFIKTLNKLSKKGMIRRYGATLRHQISGYNANAMVAWVVDNSLIESTGTTMASFKEVSHCYQRNLVSKDWPYNLYTMIHGKNKIECCNIVNKISKKTNICVYSILFSVKELKKTSMTYYNDEDL